jgi:hypothetical protein
MLQKAFKEEALSCTKVFEWFAWEKRLDKCIASNGEYFEGD